MKDLLATSVAIKEAVDKARFAISIAAQNQANSSVLARMVDGMRHLEHALYDLPHLHSEEVRMKEEIWMQKQQEMQMREEREAMRCEVEMQG